MWGFGNTHTSIYIYIGTTVDKYVITAATGLLDYIIRYTLRENSISVSLFFFLRQVELKNIHKKQSAIKR